MEKWAGLYKNIQFLTVCVDALGVAKDFGKMFGLNKAVNCHIPSRGYLPVGYGQLGCSGFTISDKNGCFVSRKTKPYLQHGEQAFDHVEELLLKHFNERPCYEEDPQCAKSDFDPINREGQDKKVPSVGVKSMDHEHHQCEQTLSSLLEAPTSKNLERFLVVLKKHFDHEEHLMESYGVGASASVNGLSPLDSHKQDHERILEIGYSELGRLSFSQARVCQTSS